MHGTRTEPSSCAAASFRHPRAVAGGLLMLVVLGQCIENHCDIQTINAHVPTSALVALSPVTKLMACRTVARWIGFGSTLVK